MLTYNFNIHNYRKNKGYMNLLDEITAKRGSIEKISSINKFIQSNVSSDIKHIFSDNCSGQNKNYCLQEDVP